MGARGPQAKPALLKLIQGNPGKRPLNMADGVNPEVAVPDAPAHLNKEGRKEWKRVSAELYALGLISRIDRAALALYCQAWGQLVLLEESLSAAMSREVAAGRDAAMAMYFVTDKGYEGQTVTVQMINTLRQQVHTFLKAFGMDPSSRSRVTASTNDGQQTLPGVEEPQGWARFAGR